MSVRDLPFSTAFRLRPVPPYDFLRTVHKPAGWSLLTPFEIFESGTLWTAMRTLGGKIFGLKLRSAGTVEEPQIDCEMYSHKNLETNERRALSNAITWMLNLEEDITQFYALAKQDPLVEALMQDLYGMRSTKRPDVFPRLILAVTLQMAPIKRSNQMMNLLIKEYGERMRFDGKEVSYWPSPETIARVGVR